MQISRHWRLNSQRYRLEGFRNSAGEVSLQTQDRDLKKDQRFKTLEEWEIYIQTNQQATEEQKLLPQRQAA